MSDYDEMYRLGFKQGIIIGIIEFNLSLVREMINPKTTNNYEEIIKSLNISEELCARMMDYLPVSREEWIIPSDLE